MVNEAELVAALEQQLGVEVRMLDFGKRPFEEEVASLQDVRVLFGMQGSGLINGWYLPPQSGTVVLYQYGGWDVFEEYLGPLGNYAWWVNEDEGSSVCNHAIDPFCDSPDTVVDVEAALRILGRALATSRAHCGEAEVTGT